MFVLEKTRRSRKKALDLLETVAWLAPLLARVTVGVLFISTGWGKVHNLQKVSAFFTELGIPAAGFNAGLVAWVELLGGALLLVGFLSRLAAVPLIVTMAVAISTAKASEIGGLPDLFGLVEWTYLVLLAWLALAGPGKASVDHAVFGRSPRQVRPASDLRSSKKTASGGSEGGSSARSHAV
jgi:putative oxidoreductase